MNPEFFDTHFHLDADDDLTELVEAAAPAGVTRMLAAGAAVGKTAQLLERVEPLPQVFAAAGIHPHEAAAFDGDLVRFREWTLHPKVKAVGEIGLDYHYDHSPREQQQEVFRRFLELAVQEDLPAIVHIREAYDDALALLREVLGGNHPFVVHCFSGTPAWAERFLELGAMISFTGLITFKKADDIRAALRVVPVERLMFETDSPYLAPVPHRGRRNQPAYVRHVVERAAMELGAALDELAAATTANARAFFQV